jgi:HD-GYP domain-containing protein (c-di-GMP phosphodiesterase class II)
MAQDRPFSHDSRRGIGLNRERVRAAEIIGALSLATDLGIGVPLEHGLHSAIVSARLSERLGVEAETAMHAYYASLLFYVGCTANMEIADDVFGGHAALTTYGTPVRFGSRPQMVSGLLRAVAPPGGAPLLRVRQLAYRVPKLVRAFKGQVAALCEVAQMLTERLGLPDSVGALFAQIDERWDGKGAPGSVRGDDIHLGVRIAQVARDAAFQSMLGGPQFAAQVIRERGGHAFDPVVANRLADEASEILALDEAASSWEEALASEPSALTLEGEAIDRALAAMGDFADLISPYFAGHSSRVAGLARAAGERLKLDDVEVTKISRAGFVHDVGRVAVPTTIWRRAEPLTPDARERVRLHAYHSERILIHSPFLTLLSPIATSHHERLDGSGYHRGATAPSLNRGSRLLAAADAYSSIVEPRPHREALPPLRAAEILTREARDGRLDAEAVAAVLDVSGQPVRRIERPAGLTEREAEVVSLLARGLQTKQVARALEISVKTADRHVQNAYTKIGISSRAAATLFAMEHGLLAWGELPMSRKIDRS